MDSSIPRRRLLQVAALAVPGATLIGCHDSGSRNALAAANSTGPLYLQEDEKNFAPTSKPLHGGMGENAFAPSLAGDLRDGLGAWTVAEIAEYLKTGSNDKSAAAGPMAEVVTDSTQYLTDADLSAIGAYLKGSPRTQPDADNGRGSDNNKNEMSRGAAVYADNCTGCHMDGGEGIPHVFPPLKGSAAVQAQKPDTIVRAVLGGAGIPATSTKPTGLKMPDFHDKLDNAQIAAVVSYIRNA